MSSSLLKVTLWNRSCLRSLQRFQINNSWTVCTIDNNPLLVLNSVRKWWRSNCLQTACLFQFFTSAASYMWQHFKRITLTFSYQQRQYRTSSHVLIHTWNSCTYLKILKSWSISESPWNRGFLVASSAKIVPVLQTSTGVEYRGEPRRTSGARYQRVTT